MTQAETALITMTERAASKMVSLLLERGDVAQVRVFVEGGGCSGYRYGLAPSPERREGDLVLTQGELTVLIDPESAPMVQGASIDFVEDVMSSGFTIENPNAPASSCGCGAREQGASGHGGDMGRCC